MLLTYYTVKISLSGLGLACRDRYAQRSRKGGQLFNFITRNGTF